MEEIKDFDQWISNLQLPPVEYVAVFNFETGKVKSVGPAHAFENEKHKIPIDADLAESIIKSEIQINSCVVDINSNTLEISQTRSVYKIDDVLHRVPILKFSDCKNADVYISHHKKKNLLKIELSKEIGGTKDPIEPYKKRNIIWSGDTNMIFYITDYNDPNVPYQVIYCTINELIGNYKTFPFAYENFSVYTRRLFKNYIIEYK